MERIREFFDSTDRSWMFERDEQDSGTESITPCASDDASQSSISVGCLYLEYTYLIKRGEKIQGNRTTSTDWYSFMQDLARGTMSVVIWRPEYTKE